MNLVNQLAERALKHPDRLAIADATGEVTYAELYQKVCFTSQTLTKDGIKKEDLILLLQPVSIDLYVKLLGIFHAGAAVMLIDPSAGSEMINYSLQLHPPTAFIGSAKAHLLRLKIPEIRHIKKAYHTSGWAPFSKKLKSHSTNYFPPLETQLDTPALITFTSGSTGKPKAACRTHGFLLAQHRALSESLHYQEKEVDLITLPVFALANLASGLSSIIADTDLRYPARAKSSQIEKQCKIYQVTRCAASPAFFKKLLDDNAFPHFKTIYTGGAPVFPLLLDQLQSINATMNLVTVFGSTEAEPIAHISWSAASIEDRAMMQSGKGLLVGNPVSATSLKIISNSPGKTFENLSQQAFDSLVLDDSNIGEIIVTGDHVLKGYLNGTGDLENKIKLSDATWHRTGDLGWVDSKNRLWLMGRSSSVIQTSNKQPLYPFGIECIAMHHPELNRCALLYHKGKIVLFVEGDNLSEKNLIELYNQLKPYQVDQIKKIDHIPVDKRHNAKIDYPELKRTIQKMKYKLDDQF